ncbi:MAG: STAS/SEC14 domain-containing protein [Gammaproteobacteria bacterium]|nr:STAS/SEC14 domain-containing protein [Gammaproteobacteria bacterium]
MMIDNGKIRIEIREGVPVLEIYHNGELELADIVWMNHTLLNNIEPPLNLPIDFIVDRLGSYSLSEAAYINMQKLVKGSRRIAFVTHSPTQDVVSDLAANSYLSEQKVQRFSSIDDALMWLQNSEQESSSNN